jgi:hypothetical protein
MQSHLTAVWHAAAAGELSTKVSPWNGLIAHGLDTGAVHAVGGEDELDTSQQLQQLHEGRHRGKGGDEEEGWVCGGGLRGAEGAEPEGALPQVLNCANTMAVPQFYDVCVTQQACEG